MLAVGSATAGGDCAAELPRLDLSDFREALAPAGVRCVLAPHRATLLPASTPFAAALDPGFAFTHTGEFGTLAHPLGKALRHAGGLSRKAQDGLVHEVLYLAMLLAGLADDPAPVVHLAVVTADEPLPEPHRLPASARLALFYVFGAAEQEGSLPADRLSPAAVESEPCRALPPASCAVIKREPGGPGEPCPGNSGWRCRSGAGRRLLLWIASRHEPADWSTAGGPWQRVSPPETVDVLLVCMPFGAAKPSLPLSLLRRTLPPGVAKVLYLSLPFARRVGHPLYHWLAGFLSYPSSLAGEWLFRQALFPELAEDPGDYVAEVLLGPTARWRNEASEEEPTTLNLIPEGLVGDLLRVREMTDGFLEFCVEEILAHRPKIVGMTSVFQQHAPSLALARRLKARAPELRIVLGGANCEGAMGLATLRRFECVDAVVNGEGEVVLPQLVERWLAGRPVDDLRGVYTPASPEVRARDPHPASAPSLRQLDELPNPDFDDFFAQYEASGLAARNPTGLFFETSRGCWWGEKQHCTFCGLNGGTMAFRSKSADRALAELKDLARRYPGLPLTAVDSILDVHYFSTLLPRLAGEDLRLDIFYEVKANLRKEQLRILHAAGVRSIQPGIESLSDEVLRIMRKGVSALQNIRLLKWCEEIGLRPFWNLIWGFPGEPPVEYARMAELIPLLHHLPPPNSYFPILLERFSPNFFQSEKLGFANVRPIAAYGYLYPPLPTEDRDDIAYIFSYDYQEPRDVDGYTRLLARRVGEWQDSYTDCTLTVVETRDRLMIVDTRPRAKERLTFAEGLARKLYLACDDVATIEQLCILAGTETSRREIEEALLPFLERGQLIRQGNLFLALACRSVPAPAR